MGLVLGLELVLVLRLGQVEVSGRVSASVMVTVRPSGQTPQPPPPQTLLQLLPYLVAVTFPPSSRPHGGGSCVTAWDCSLGGICDNGHCVCDIWFTGTNCALLHLNRTNPNSGLQIPGYHSWGGRGVSSVDGSGKFHGYFSFICRHLEMPSWTKAR